MRKGQYCSPELRARLSECKRGERHPLWGKHPSAETRAKMSAAHRGRRGPWAGKRLSAEHRAKIGAAQRGKPNGSVGRHHTAEARAKISMAMRGRISPTLGWHPSDSTRAKLRACHLGKPSPLKGRRISPERRARIATASKLMWQDPEFRDRIVHASRAGSRKRPTAPERRVHEILDRHFPGEWRYTGNGQVVIGGFNPDFTNVNGQKSVVEVFGDYWHGQQKTGRTRDVEVGRRIAHFAKYGFRCAVIWEHEAKDEALVLTKVSEKTTSARGENV